MAPLRVHQQQTFKKATVLEEDFNLKINLEESRQKGPSLVRLNPLG